jgi:hypothetical protein
VKALDTTNVLSDRRVTVKIHVLAGYVIRKVSAMDIIGHVFSNWRYRSTARFSAVSSMRCSERSMNSWHVSSR